MDIEIILEGLLLTSSLTGLVTEGVKKILAENNKNCSTNMLSGWIALALSCVIGIGYIANTGISVDGRITVGFVIYVLLAWLCSMLGYDKVSQTVSQMIRENK